MAYGPPPGPGGYGSPPGGYGPPGGGYGSPYYGTLDEWRANFPNATVLAFGFSLGSGVLGASGSGAAPFNNPDNGTPSYFFASGGVGGSWTEGGFNQVRMFIS